MEGHSRSMAIFLMPIFRLTHWMHSMAPVYLEVVLRVNRYAVRRRQRVRLQAARDHWWSLGAPG
jgi:hypothetical protein